VFTMPARFAELGNRHAAMDRAAGSLDALLDMAARDEHQLTAQDFATLANDYVLKESVKKHWPSLLPLLKSHATQTMSFLIHSGAVLVFRASSFVTIGHSGDDNLKTWADYRTKILTFLDGVNSDPLYKDAREKVATKIHWEHYKALPKWPKPGPPVSTSVPVSCDGYSENLEYEVHWSVTGTVNVSDQTTFIPPASFRFETSFNGNPVFKSVKIVKDELKRLRLRFDNNPVAATRVIQEFVPPHAIKFTVPF